MIAMKLPILLFLLGLVSLSRQNGTIPRVETSLGRIVGYYKHARNGRTYEAYEGIPYAEPPVGEHRFEPPVPVKKWESELPATKRGSICTQYVMASMAVEGERVKGCEDCLYLNVYVPTRNSSQQLLPVMVWIHGGAYQFGSANDLDETLLMEREIILITINYRLGPFGFLSTEDETVSGNMGLKDQNLALKWVNNHIRNFGGNPQEVTLFGLSAGGASVHFHYLTPLSAGLFKRGISISGTALDPWAQIERPVEKAKELGAHMGCPTANVKNMITCLKDRPARVIAQAVSDFMVWLYNPTTPFGPVIEKNAHEPFISRSPMNIINRGEAHDLPWISGVVSEEGIFPAGEFIANNELLKQLNDRWEDIAPFLLDYNDTVSLGQQKDLSRTIRSQYLGNKTISSETVEPLIHLIGDRLYSFDFEKAVRLQARINKSPVWTYLYSYRALHSLSELLTEGSTKNYGVSQGDDVLLLTLPNISNTSKPEDLQMQQLLLDFYTSFAIDGKPKISNVNWMQLQPFEKGFHYLHIENPKKISMECNSNFAQKNFWRRLNFDENDHENENDVCPISF